MILEINKYIYNNNIEKGKKKVILVEYQRYLTFTAKCLEGLSKEGPQNDKIK